MLIKIARTVAIFLVKPQSAVLNSVVSQTFCVCVSNTNSHSGAGSYDFISNVGIAPNAVSNHGHSPDYFKIFRFQNGNDSQKSCHIGCSTLVPGHALKIQKLVKLQDLSVSHSIFTSFFKMCKEKFYFKLHACHNASSFDVSSASVISDALANQHDGFLYRTCKEFFSMTTM